MPNPVEWANGIALVAGKLAFNRPSWGHRIESSRELRIMASVEEHPVRQKKLATRGGHSGDTVDLESG